MTARLLTNIGRLWTGSEILSNAAIVTSDDRIAWVGPSANSRAASLASSTTSSTWTSWRTSAAAWSRPA